MGSPLFLKSNSVRSMCGFECWMVTAGCTNISSRDRHPVREMMVLQSDSMFGSAGRRCLLGSYQFEALSFVAAQTTLDGSRYAGMRFDVVLRSENRTDHKLKSIFRFNRTRTREN